MNELTMDRLKENLESLKMKNTLEILDNYLERAVEENLYIDRGGFGSYLLKRSEIQTETSL